LPYAPPQKDADGWEESARKQDSDQLVKRIFIHVADGT